MSIKLNHTIVHSRDKALSAAFLTEILGLSAPKPFSHFLVVQLDNEITLDVIETNEDFERQHYAFLVSETEFDEIFGRINERGISFWADSFHRRANEINTNDGGRGCYFADPDGHNLEIITRPYGGND
jgi:catechol 2,3-dioxygenase-like lactoylglutathione lyase family enzyme